MKESPRSLREVKEDGLGDLAEVIEALYGHRCGQREAGCMTCTAWTVFDALANLVHSDHLADGKRLFPERDSERC